MTRLFWLVWVVLLLSPSAIAAERLTVSVSPPRSFSPTNLEIRLHVEPDTSNRTLEVVAESDDYLRSSRLQLDGESAPQHIQMEFRSLPGGDYVVRATVLDSMGRARATAHAEAIILHSATGR